MSRKINCSILTPEKQIYEGNVNLVVVNAFDGEMGFLFNHSPLITELKIGEVRLRTESKTDHMIIEGGIAQIRDNKLIILAEYAMKKEDIDKNEVENKLKELKQKEVDPLSDDKVLIKIEEEKLKVRLKVANR